MDVFACEAEDAYATVTMATIAVFVRACVRSDGRRKGRDRQKPGNFVMEAKKEASKSDNLGDDAKKQSTHASWLDWLLLP